MNSAVGGRLPYSPDFAYVVKGIDGQSNLNFIVETKGKSEIALSDQEKRKIEHAKAFFVNISHDVQVHFKRQLKSEKILDMIKELQA